MQYIPLKKLEIIMTTSQSIDRLNISISFYYGLNFV